MIRRTIVPLLLFLGLALLPIAPARAVVGVSPLPASQAVSVGNASSISVVWNVRHDELSCVPTITSQAGEFRAQNIAGPVLGTVPLPVSRTVGCSGVGFITYPFAESVLVPADVVQRALKLGATRIVYIRTFTAFVSSTGVVNLDIRSSSAATFGVTHEALSFDNGAPVRILPRGEPLSARAEIGYNGAGVLQAVWEVASPASTSGTPIYSVVSHVRKNLTSGEREVLNSPALPTASTGLYLVRLRITSPEPPFEAPVIRYFVGEGRPGHELPPQPLALGAPPRHVLLAPDTDFAWEAIKGARAYQLEIYRSGVDQAYGLPDLGGETALRPTDVAAALSRPPVTGMLVPGKQRRTTLSAAARQHLLSGQVYLWRVVAIGEDGARIGQSPVRELRTP